MVFVAGCLEHHHLRQSAAERLGCPASETELRIEGHSARAEGCGGVVGYEKVCRLQTSFKPSKTETTPGRYERRCGYQGFGTSRQYRCQSVFVQGSSKYTPSKTEYQTICHWVSQPQTMLPGVRARGQASNADGPEAPGRPEVAGATSEPSAMPQSKPGSESPPAKGALTRVVVDDLYELVKVEEVLRGWLGRSVRLELVDQRHLDGVLISVLHKRIWLADGQSFRLKDIFVAELLESQETP
jgi:hypothetical protein